MNEIASLVQELYGASNEVVAGELTLSYRRKGDVRVQNKRMDALWAVLNELAERPDGRLALDALLRDCPTTELRISIANVVMR